MKGDDIDDDSCFLIQSSSLLALKDRLARQYFINARCCLMQNAEEHKRVISNGTMWRYSKNGENERITSAGPTHTSVLVVVGSHHATQNFLSSELSFSYLSS